MPKLPLGSMECVHDALIQHEFPEFQNKQALVFGNTIVALIRQLLRMNDLSEDDLYAFLASFLTHTNSALPYQVCICISVYCLDSVISLKPQDINRDFTASLSLNYPKNPEGTFNGPSQRVNQLQSLNTLLDRFFIVP